MSFVRAASVHDFKPGAAVAAVVGGVEVALAHEEGEYFAVRDLCTHAYISLSEGDVENCAIECWAHGAAFDLRSGEPTCPPATEPVATFPVKVEGDDVLVDVTTTLNGVKP